MHSTKLWNRLDHNNEDNNPESPRRLLKKYNLSTITAVAVSSNIILVGDGPVLHIYDPVELSCYISQQLFPTHNIHGFAVESLSQSDTVVLAWGGKNLCSFLLRSGSTNAKSDRLDSELEVLDKRLHLCSDWILHCAFTKTQYNESSSCFYAAAITAHNALLGLTLCLDVTKTVVPSLALRLRSLSRASRCMLYAARLYWITSQYIVIAAGSAFGDVIVWSFAFDVDPTTAGSNASHIAIHYMFPAHDGSVFGVDLMHSDKCRQNGEVQLLLGTCSDDRTIRIWDVSKALPCSRPSQNLDVQNLTKLNQGTNPADLFETNVQLNAQHITTAWGHLSRIWQVLFVVNRTPDQTDGVMIKLISVGEDASLQTWELETSHDAINDNLCGTLKHVSSHYHHSGKNIWSIACSPYYDESVECVTGGADGSASILVAAGSTSSSNHMSKTIQKVELSKIMRGWPTTLDESLTPVRNSLVAIKDFFRSYDFVDMRTILATTNHGYVLSGTLIATASAKDRLFVGQINDFTNYEWEMIAHFDSFSSFSIVVGVPATSIGFVGSSNGSVYLYKEQHLHGKPIVQMETKISSLFAHVVGDARAYSTFQPPRDTQDCQQKRVALLVTCLGLSVAKLFFLSCFEDTNHGMATPIDEAIDLQLASNFIPSCVLCLSIQEFSDVVLIGSRSGLVAKYVLNRTAEMQQTNPREQWKILDTDPTRFHADAVTSMTWEFDSSYVDRDGSNCGFLLTTGRDSSYAIHQISLNKTLLSPVLVHKTTLPFGPNIEGCYLTSQSRRLIFYGFKSKDFLVFDETNQDELLRVECGGAHRSWAFRPPVQGTVDGGGLFIWTQASKLNTVTGLGLNRRLIRLGGHGRDIKACAVCPVLHRIGQSYSHIIASGAEDTDIRLFRYAPKNDHTSGEMDSLQLECVSIIRKHDTGIQQLQWSSDGQYLFSSGGCEEFNIWRIRNISFVKIGVVCEGSLPAMSILQDLRIMGFEALPTSNSAIAGDKSPEHPCFTISMVFSDSTLRRYIYTSSPHQSTWTLVETGKYGMCCLTQIQHLSGTPGASGRDRLVTAGTDGTMAIWSLPLSAGQPGGIQGRIATLCRTRIHQNTIKCLSVTALSRSASGFNTYLVVTGGDDNGLALTRIDYDPNFKAEFKATVTSSRDAGLRSATLLIPRAHAAAISALVVLSPLRSTLDTLHDSTHGRAVQLKRLRVLTAGNDQRLKIWHVSVDLDQEGVDGIKVKRGENVFTPVADVGSMAVLSKGESGELTEAEAEVVVCGVGMDVWCIRR